MEKRIKRLRWIASIFNAFAKLNIFLIGLGFILFLVSVFGQNIKLPDNFITSFGAAIPIAFLFYTASVILDFLADAGEEMLNLKWGVRDVRRKLLAVRGEEETRPG